MQNEKVDPRKRKNQDELEGRLRYEGDLPFDDAIDADGPIIEVSLEELYDEEIYNPDRDLAILHPRRILKAASSGAGECHGP